MMQTMNRSLTSSTPVIVLDFLDAAIEVRNGADGYEAELIERAN
jgi:hypothetical protein